MNNQDKIKIKKRFIVLFTEIHKKRHFNNKILNDFIEFTKSEIEILEKRS